MKLSFNRLESDLFRSRTWKVGHGRQLELGPKAILMGILNVTPDSFSDGGHFSNIDAALSQAEKMIGEGAHIIDVGGESTKPNGTAVTADIEQQRVIPVIEALAKNFDTLISIDTYRAETAELGVKAGAHIVNDVWGLRREEDIADVVARHNAGVCIMHTGRDRDKDDDVINDQKLWFRKSLEIATRASIADNAIILDPGFGFAKNVDENLELMLRFSELNQFEYPILAGASRKRFIGALVDRDPENIDIRSRDIGTSATSVLLRMQGASIFRVHDVGLNRDALAIADGLIKRSADKRSS
ncbi:dihydropteroate synthase [Lentilitoribacter sp. EG35]|uniref:dihydropteroate synthase n=1 Tax=Lentilitoribacter sp. EG35 TaxID=3234192 RepID=UPI0034612CAF